MIAIGLAALKQYPQFIVYRTELDATTGKLNKIPTVSVTDPSKWMSYDAAFQFASQYPGKLFVGFVLCPELSRIAVIDVDGCRDKETGKLSALALTMIAMLPGAYVEVSISGTGIHIWFSYSGEMLPHSCKANGLEFYHTERFFALGTELIAEGFINGSVEMDLTVMLPALIGTYLPPAPQSFSGAAQEWTDGPCEEWNGPADDGELLRRARRSIGAAAAFDPDKATFSDLWEANEAKLSRAYPDSKRSYDASSADAALAQHLAFWTGNDCERIKRIMEGSCLVRDKWERGDYLTPNDSECCRASDGGISGQTSRLDRSGPSSWWDSSNSHRTNACACRHPGFCGSHLHRKNERKDALRSQPQRVDGIRRYEMEKGSAGEGLQPHPRYLPRIELRG
jgi:primase-polymerase (primpol)-like protein